MKGIMQSFVQQTVVAFMAIVVIITILAICISQLP